MERVLSELERGSIFSARDLNDDTLVRVKATLHEYQSFPSVGETWQVEGELATRVDRYGRRIPQISTRKLRRTRTSGLLLRPWLQQLPNIGPVRAQRLLATFGDGLPSVLSDPAQMPAVAVALDGTKKKLALLVAQQLYTAMARKNAADLTMLAEVDFLSYLEGLGVSNARAARSLWRLVSGVDAKERLARNPYLASALMTWAKADHVGQKLLRAQGVAAVQGHEQRLLGAVTSAWRDILDDGDTAATEERFKALLEARKVNSDGALTIALEKRAMGRLGVLYRAPGAAWLEDTLSARLKALEKAPDTVLIPADPILERGVRSAQTATGLTLSAEQQDAVMCLLRLRLGVLQGGAGVGKTTVMKVLVTVWETLGGEVVLGALAGKAALQLARGASSPAQPRLAYTIARLIRMLKSAKSARDFGTPIAADCVQVTDKTLLILDEASMVDTPSLHEVLSLVPVGARLLLVGDHGQLPSVGIGRVFHDLVDDGTRVLSLTKVMRQAADSPIPYASVDVREGRMPALAPWTRPATGIFLAQPPHTLLSIYEEVHKLGDVMVVAAKRDTVHQVNAEASAMCRPLNAHSVRLGPLATVAVGDPVVCTRNRYSDGLFNGLLGRVTGIDENEAVSIHWDGEDTPRVLDAQAASDIELAYAITCHKAQGSSAKTVIVVVEDSRLVTREWLYTAITRARESVILIAKPGAIEAAIERRTERVTGFVLE